MLALIIYISLWGFKRKVNFHMKLYTDSIHYKMTTESINYAQQQVIILTDVQYAQ